MIDIQNWVKNFTEKLEATFGDRIWFTGLQGSYGRGEATDNSDIDMVVILDEINSNDLKVYNAMLDELPHRELICGFISGRDELMNWAPSDLFQLCYDTTPIMGSLDSVIELIDSEAVNHAVKIGAGNLYHGCVHNMLYEKSEDILQELYKAAAFTVQVVYFRQTGKYIRKRSELIHAVNPEEHEILTVGQKLKNGEPVDFTYVSELMFNWTKNLLNIQS